MRTLRTIRVSLLVAKRTVRGCGGVDCKALGHGNGTRTLTSSSMSDFICVCICLSILLPPHTTTSTQHPNTRTQTRPNKPTTQTHTAQTPLNPGAQPKSHHIRHRRLGTSQLRQRVTDLHARSQTALLPVPHRALCSPARVRKDQLHHRFGRAFHFHFSSFSAACRPRGCSGLEHGLADHERALRPPAPERRDRPPLATFRMREPRRRLVYPRLVLEKSGKEERTCDVE